MKKTIVMIFGVLLVLTNIASADIFGTGENQFAIDCVNISGDTNPTSGYGIVNNDYRMGKFEITNDQWEKFTNINGIPTGSPSNAYDGSSYWTGTNVPTNNVSWYETVQFVNYLNTITGHQAAYKFTEAGDFAVWEIGDSGYDADNPFRNSNAYYFLPTEDEWVKAAYWNGTNLQSYATTEDSVPVAGVDTNYGQSEPFDGPWDVGSGSEELNDTFDMMGNVWEWLESPYFSGDFGNDSIRGIRGGSFANSAGGGIRSSYLFNSDPYYEFDSVSFRVASVPEPCSIVLLFLGALSLFRKRKP